MCQALARNFTHRIPFELQRKPRNFQFLFQCGQERHLRFRAVADLLKAPWLRDSRSRRKNLGPLSSSGALLLLPGKFTLLWPRLYKGLGCYSECL
jgi:hypothetical protein